MKSLHLQLKYLCQSLFTANNSDKATQDLEKHIYLPNNYFSLMRFGLKDKQRISSEQIFTLMYIV